MKRVEQFALSLLLVLTLLTGCGSNISDKAPNWTENAQQSSEVYDSSSNDRDAAASGEIPIESNSGSLSAPTSDSTQDDSALEALSPSVSSGISSQTQSAQYIADDYTSTFSLKSVPAYSGNAYVALNNNSPYFDVEQLTAVSVEYYSPLDSLERCGMTYACVGQDLMPTEERGSIGMVKPTGWHTVKYDCVDGGYLYNRCHLIGYQLSGENANTQNLITGTRYLNIQGMLPFENMIADYVKETDNHVAYRVTPIFNGDNLLADGVLMEGYSIEDDGDGVCFCVFAYNVQPGVTIEYATGESSLVEQPTEPSATDNTSVSNSNDTKQDDSGTSSNTTETEKVTASYILNTNSKKFHYPTCSSVGQMKDANKQEYTGSRDDLIAKGYSPCGRCHP